MSLRQFAKSCIVAWIGDERRPRRILRGLASGYRICVSPADNLSYLLGTAEPHLQRIIRQYVSAGDTVYDVGANLGYVSLSLARQVGPGGHVFAFEPVPENLECLGQTIEANRLTNVTVFDTAASNTCGQATIRMKGNSSMPSLMWYRNDASAAAFRVRTVTIDSLVQAGKIARPGFVKIDVEGAEGLVLQGMRETIRSARPVLVLECSEVGRETTWNLLRELGYHCQSAITRRSVSTFDQYGHSDFLWLPPAS